MSTHDRLDLALLGNVTVDETYAISGWPKGGTSNDFSSRRLSLGGIMNVCEALVGTGVRVSVSANVGRDEDGEYIRREMEHWVPSGRRHLTASDNETTRALVVSDLHGERTSFVRWGCGRDEVRTTNAEARWAHIAYLDVIDKVDIDDLRARCDVISADLCLSSPGYAAMAKVLWAAEKLDYLFMSEAEALPYAGEPGLLVGAARNMRGDNLRNKKRPTIVIHNGTGTLLYDGESHHVPNTLDRLEGVDVLGAGDAYCAGFIAQMLSQEDPIGAARAGHVAALRYLKKKNKRPE